MEASPLAGWENFYVIIGSAAGGLTGLTFVVIALIRDVASASTEGMRAFVTPTIVHFGGVLALACFVSMPHPGAATLSAGFALAGVAGVVYGGFIAWNLRHHGTPYVVVREDWIYNVIVPTLLYAWLCLMAALIWRRPAAAAYGVGAFSLILLFVGIRNAWDIAVWMTIHKGR
jgi:hypothetical protein